MITSLAPGDSLLDYMKKKSTVGLRSAIVFCLKLLRIVESFHACGVVHRDLKPDNIHIDCSNNRSLEEGIITVLDFGLAYIKGGQMAYDVDFDGAYNARSEDDMSTDLGCDIANSFYQIPQLLKQRSSAVTEFEKNQTIQQRRSPSIDVTYVCAILFWLLTGKKPGVKYAAKTGPPPHRELLQENPSVWNVVVDAAVESSSECTCQLR